MKTLALILMMACPAYAGQLSSKIPGMALLSHLNEGTGTAIGDSITNTNGTLNSGTWVQGFQGKGLRFQTNQYATLQDVNVSTNALTYGVWAKWGANTISEWHGLFTKWQGDNNGSGFRIITKSTSTTYFWIESDIGATGSSFTTFGWHYTAGKFPNARTTWVFIVTAFQSGKMYTYLNGKLVAQNLAAKASVTDPATNGVSLGRMQWTSPANFFCTDCSVDEPFVIKRFLTAGEIQRMYLEQLGNHSD